MKLTWFAGMTFRFHIAGEIVVTKPEGAPGTVDTTEVMGGADRVVGDESELAAFDAGSWRRRKPARLIDAEAEAPKLEVFRLGAAGIALDAPEEGLVLLCDGDAAGAIAWGRWADGAVVVLGPGAGTAGQAVLAGARPRLIALAVPAAEADAAFGTLAQLLDGAGLIALEPGLAVEI